MSLPACRSGGLCCSVHVSFYDRQFSSTVLDMFVVASNVQSGSSFPVEIVHETVLCLLGVARDLEPFFGSLGLQKGFETVKKSAAARSIVSYTAA